MNHKSSTFSVEAAGSTPLPLRDMVCIRLKAGVHLVEVLEPMGATSLIPLADFVAEIPRSKWLNPRGELLWARRLNAHLLSSPWLSVRQEAMRHAHQQIGA